jgi:hypothetical protein
MATDNTDYTTEPILMPLKYTQNKNKSKKGQECFNVDTKSNKTNILETYIKEENTSFEHFLKRKPESVLFMLLKDCGPEFKTCLQLVLKTVNTATKIAPLHAQVNALWCKHVYYRLTRQTFSHESDISNKVL